MTKLAIPSLLSVKRDQRIIGLLCRHFTQSKYAGTVMTSFEHIMIPTRGNWFQTNPLEHELGDRAGNTLSSVCVTNGKDMALQRQIWSTFVTVLWFRKTKIKNRAGILILVRVLWVTISKIYWHFWHNFFKFTFKRSSIFYPKEITGRKMARSVCLDPCSANGNVTFAYIMTFHHVHCTSI